PLAQNASSPTSQTLASGGGAACCLLTMSACLRYSWCLGTSLSIARCIAWWAQVTWEGELNRLRRGGYLLHVVVATLIEEFQNLAHQKLWNGSTTGDADSFIAIELLFLDLLCVVN